MARYFVQFRSNSTLANNLMVFTGMTEQQVRNEVNREYGKAVQRIFSEPDAAQIIPNIYGCKEQWVAFGSHCVYTEQDYYGNSTGIMEYPRSKNVKPYKEHEVHLGKETLFDDCQNWFQVCKPSPTESDISTQAGAVLEEMAEFVESLGLSASQLRDYSTQFYQNSLPIPETVEDKVNQLDAISDILVTLTGYSYMKGFDLKGAFEEVNLSNASKLENGKPVLREDGKIMKGKDYKAPELKPFIGK